VVLWGVCWMFYVPPQYGNNFFAPAVIDLASFGEKNFDPSMRVSLLSHSRSLS
jgi:hypothetical protein